MQIIEKLTLDEERALYNLQNARVSGCTFAGPADGESALKECRSVDVEGCHFLLRYPLWHAEDFTLSDSDMAETARAALWYAKHGRITDCSLHGVKCLRECDGITVDHCDVSSEEFGWKCRGVDIDHSRIESVYFLLDSRDVTLRNVDFKGKYSFQYVENLVIENCTLDTKDAFWHGKNVTVRDSVIKGEYLAWYSDGLTLENCRIIGTQPLCYCKNLRLINCTMEQTDLAFEYSDVEAEILGEVMSVKNPRSGHITADGFGEIIRKDPVIECSCEISVRK